MIEFEVALCRGGCGFGQLAIHEDHPIYMTLFRVLLPRVIKRDEPIATLTSLALVVGDQALEARLLIMR